MCLSRVDKKPKEFKNKIGYKVVLQHSDGRLLPVFQGSPRFEVGKWVKDRKRKDITFYSYVKYPTGFHIFRTKQAAMDYRGFSSEVCYKCEYDNVVATGWQDGKRVIVARKIKLLEKV